MTSPIEHSAALHIGLVESVAPDGITVKLDSEAPQTTALNSGVPSVFPRLNGYVLIPKESGALVGLVVWLGVERSPIPRAKFERSDGAFVDLPFPQRKMVVAPVGTLLIGRASNSFSLERGIVAYPSVGDEVLVPTKQQLRAIVEPAGANARVALGEAVLAPGSVVGIDPDKLFGRHVAVLGNTGSGKSCTVAGLVRWSLEGASIAAGKPPNARFIVLDPNGEYAEAFADIPGGVRVFRAPPDVGSGAPLQVPSWLWNGHEWAAFAAASPRVQRPLLMRALRDLRSGSFAQTEDQKAWFRLNNYIYRLTVLCSRGVAGLGDFGPRQDVGGCLVQLETDAKSLAVLVSPPHRAALVTVFKSAEKLRLAKKPPSSKFFDVFAQAELDVLIADCRAAADALPRPKQLGTESEDSPIQFDVARVADHLEMLTQDDGMGQAAAFVSSLVMRIRTMMGDVRMRPLVQPDAPLALEKWLESYIGADDGVGGAVAVVDLSLVPSDVVHVVVAVLGRVIFEATQRYRRKYAQELPTVLVLEEAHSFIRGSGHSDGDVPTPSQMCRETFERIAREGRKFGLGLMLSSQRPSELSATVLAQCNTFVLHRLVNDRDQELVQRLVPDNLGGLMKELPTLPTRHAILLGWASALPVLTRIRELPKAHRPRSADPAFWDTWTRVVSRRVDWSSLAADWCGSSMKNDESDEGAEVEAVDEL